jgi:hypothetical protein
MKTIAVVLLALAGMVASGAEPKSGAPKSPAQPEAKDEAPAKIEGMEIARGGGRYLGLAIVDGKFRLAFYDAKKKPVAPDASRAVLRWDAKYKVGLERVVLTPGDGNVLTSERFIRPPYNFKLTIVLLGDAASGDEPAGETYVIDYHQ